MHRWIALVLGVTVAALAARGPALHIHAYSDHNHPEHHHGPAAHAHVAAKGHGPDGTARLDGCDPSQHVVSLAVAYETAQQQVHSIDAATVSPFIVIPELTTHHAFILTDVRVHDPPPRAQTSPRAPPLTPSA